MLLAAAGIVVSMVPALRDNGDHNGDKNLAGIFIVRRKHYLLSDYSSSTLSLRGNFGVAIWARRGRVSIWRMRASTSSTL